MEQHAPATYAAIRPPDAIATQAALDAIGTWWGPELDEWFSLHAGATHMSALALPNYSVSSPADLATNWSELVEVWTTDPSEAGSIADRRAEEAGTPAGVFLPEFVPFANEHTGYYLFVDTRPGPQQWCITEFAHSEADETDIGWASLEELLAGTADALEANRPLGSYYARTTQRGEFAGEMEWGLVGHEEEEEEEEVED
ncbi:hypothetical protein D1871_18415 [Nakamurella silvestris]|nr:hypothetical protein D1871_18415 [Nakamurella silvestris]